MIVKKLLRENNYIEMEYLMKSIYHKHFKKGKITFNQRDFEEELYGKKIPVDMSTLNDIINLYKEYKLPFNFKNQYKLESKNEGTYPFKIIMSIEEEDLVITLATLLKKISENELDYNLSVDLWKKQSNVGIRVNNNETLKIITKLIRKNIDKETLKPNIPYIPTFFNLGYVKEKVTDAAPYEDIMNTCLYNHIKFSMRRKKIDLCNPDFIIKNLEFRVEDKKISKEVKILYHLKLIEEYARKEQKYEHIR